MAAATAYVAGVAQFIDNSTNLSVAMSTFRNGSSNDLYTTLSVPQRYGWGAVGLGQKMDGSIMFVIYPSSDNTAVTLSLRTANGHNEPYLANNLDCRGHNLTLQNSIMNAGIVCYGLGNSSVLGQNFSKAPWIWAVGPNQNLVSSATDAKLVQHSANGQFFVDMLATSSQLSVPTLPTITGSQNLNVVGNDISMFAVYVHAALLGGSFLVLFPLGVVILRLTSVRMHQIVQLVTLTLCLIGLIFAVIMSARSALFASFNWAHQLMGLVAVLALALQACLGYINHRAFTLTGKPTPARWLHLGLGRILLPFGMLTGAVGFTLASNTAAAIGYAIVSIIVLVLLVLFVLWQRRRTSRRQDVYQLDSRNSTKDDTRYASNQFRTGPEAADQYEPRRS